MGTVRVHEKAREDVVQIFLHVARQNLTAALRVNEAIEEAFIRLADNPGLGAIYESGDPNIGGFRFWPIRKYRNYLVVYKPCDDGIEVFRVVHGAQDINRVRFR